MALAHRYGAAKEAAPAIRIEDITNDETNRNILRRLKQNDPNLDMLVVTPTRRYYYEDDASCPQYCPEGALDSGWIGYFIGKNTNLKGMALCANPFDGFDNEPFFRGLCANRSIQHIVFDRMESPWGGKIYQSMRPFCQNNHSLSKLWVHESYFDAGCAQQLSLVLRDCTSLKSVSFERYRMAEREEEEQFLVIIEALNMHPQLESLQLGYMNFGKYQRTMLTNLLHHTVTNLLEFKLLYSPVEGAESLVDTLTNSNRRLRVLHLSINNYSPANGWQGLASVLEEPNSNLEELNFQHDNLGDEEALIFANALACSCKLKSLELYQIGPVENGVTSAGWSGFSKVLCDASSVNNTFLSNHTLENLGLNNEYEDVPLDVASSLALNKSSDDKKEVAIKKILKHHQHFDMQPFFEWELKVLPIAITWFEIARSKCTNEKAGIDRRQLDAIYQYIHTMPEVFVPAPAGGKRKRSGS